MQGIFKHFATAALGLAAGAALSLTPALAADPVRVSSKIDTEGALLGNMMAQLLENADIPVEENLQLGPTNIVRTALLQDEIDVYPEYTGNGAFFTQTADDPAWKKADKAYAKIRAYDKQHNDLVWLEPAPANNTWAIALRRDIAEKHDLSTMADFAAWVRNGGEVKLAGSAEFVESDAALPSFQRAYDFKLDQNQLLVLSGGNTAATIRAAARGTSGTNAAMVYGTDGAIAAAGLKVMDDPRGVQMVYQPAPVIRQATLETYPRIPEILAPAFKGLDRETLQRLNRRIQVDGEPASDVVRDYLESRDLLD
ncbi:osmoprotectant transport system substrate-binding protein [Chromohalobacter marismortui]|uniref:Osmoprotectant transport system substrate-binding protein n=1 Tax=Chromohalobacter marismortui TaxID=42055 RepID=A0A4R7NIT4_9GAMM|nr:MULTISPECIES: ABC transporter substrate-binding protein [Chromohalobacter]MCI0510916.1 ABC transporter substrate-binding protein [Chromohalobacter sp.]MCI0592944.1 ABC transporter substrate-binding protein [Chromohalobacter sp.]TDU20150.1 osmoprotectant transport system substrate-binding protein [Chromohalobacter marismortui]